MKQTALALLALLTLPACEREAEPSQAPPPPLPPVSTPETVSPKANGPAAATEERVPSRDELPVPEDFAAEAVTQIDERNYKAELDELERAIKAHARER